jgi:predicted RNA binding protein YcfA (HicA-like mRNA interferase family)
MRAYEFLLEDNPDYDEDRYLKSDPGTPLSFPKGTTLVNVSDVYDWYKLGMAVSDLDDADPRTFNKGVPHTVFAFGSEEEEHKMIPLLKRLGFSLHDIDSPEDYEKAIRADEAIAHLEQVIDEGSSSIITIRDAKRALLALGFTPTGRGKGSHNVWKDEAGRLFTIPVHGKDLEYGVAKHLLKLIKNKKEQEELEEMAGTINVGISQALAKKGYQYLGGGIDKQAYLEPGTGQVYIVFGYRNNFNEFSPDQRMFIDWINYCNKNANNPHLPKFSGFDTFQYGGKNYIQARMEALKELPDEVGDLVGQLDQVTKKKFRDYRKPLRTAAQYATFQSAEEGNNTWYELEDVIEYLGGEQAAENLLQTLYQVQKFAKQHKFTIDLHRGNYMARADGTIVVNDPFVLWLTSSGNRQPWGLQ